VNEAEKSSRTANSIGNFIIAIVVSLLLHWFARLALRTAADLPVNTGDPTSLASINENSLPASFLITAIVAIVAVVSTYKDMTPPENSREHLGVRYWRDLWAPVLIGTAIYAGGYWLFVIVGSA
jgi:hypothetical protein